MPLYVSVLQSAPPADEADVLEQSNWSRGTLEGSFVMAKSQQTLDEELAQYGASRASLKRDLNRVIALAAENALKNLSSNAQEAFYALQAAEAAERLLAAMKRADG